MAEEKITIEQKPKSKVREYAIVAAITVGVMLFIFLFIWLPLKIVPKILSNVSSSSVATVLSSTPIPDNKPAATSSTSNTNQTTGGTVVKNPVVINYYGKPDLEITLISTGVVNRSTGQYIQTSSAGANDEIAMKFIVRNVGTNVSGPWSLRLNMPSRTTPTYDSNQPSIKPGGGIEYTASFNTPTNQGVNTGYILIDPFYAVDESSKTNNNLTITFNVSGTSAYNPGGYTTSYTPGYTTGTYTTYPSYYYGNTYTWSSVSAQCYGNPQNAHVGSMVTWNANVAGGTGYPTYNWSGTDNLYSTSGNTVSQVYYTPGIKYATVVVTENGQTITASCGVNVY